MTSKFLAAALIAFAVMAKGVYAEDAKPAAKPAEKKADAKKDEKKAEKKKDDKAAKPGSDADVLKADSKGLMDAFKAKDIDKVLTHYSDKFTSPKLQDKAAVKALLDMASNSGYLDNLTIEDKDSKITVDGDKATVGPIVMTGSFGTATNIFHCTKADGKWSITGMDLDGVDI